MVSLRGLPIDRAEQKVLGSYVRSDCKEDVAAQHRASQSWKSFHKWRHVLCCNYTSMEQRITFWQKTVGVSLLWCVDTLRGHKTTLRILRSAQRLQIVKMMGIKRRSTSAGQLEPWLDWHIRRFRAAKQAIEQSKADIVVAAKQKTQEYAKHMSRFGTGGRDCHLVKEVALWRPKSWWKLQQRSNSRSQYPFTHPGFFGLPRSKKSNSPPIGYSSFPQRATIKS